MRCYHFGNFYMSSIQQGIQAAHAQMELFIKFQKKDSYEYIEKDKELSIEELKRAKQTEVLYEWAENHKTMICLNGGMNAYLLEIKQTFKKIHHMYPWVTFHEADESLGGVITNVAIVLPAKIYEMSSFLKRNGSEFRNLENMTHEEFDFTFETFMNSFIDEKEKHNHDSYEDMYQYGKYKKDEIRIAQFIGQFSLAK